MISIIVSVYERPELLANFVINLFESIQDIEYEVVFSIDGPQNIQIYNILRELSSKKNVVVLDNGERSGYSVANNAGADCSKYDTLVFINTDCFPETGTIKSLAEVVSTDKTIGGAQAVLLYPQTNRVQSCGHVYGDYFSKHLFANRKFDAKLIGEVAERQSLTAALVAIRKDVFYACGCFRESYYNAFEGKELSLKVHDSGLRNIVLPHAKAYHLQGATREQGYIDKYSQLGQFWARCKDLVRNELVDIFSMQVSATMQERKYQGIVVDYYRDWPTLAEQSGLGLLDSAFLGPVERSIIIEDMLPSALFRSGEPVLFMVESIRNIQGNYNWLASRKGYGDIVMDRHGNLLELNDM